MTLCCWLLIALLATVILLYHRCSVIVWAMAMTAILGLATGLGNASWFGLTVCWIVLAAVSAVFVVRPIRRHLIGRRLFALYKKLMPSMSSTESEALAAGTVGWDSELFSGAPNWKKLFEFEQPKFSEEEQAFMDGPVEQLCSMIDDWRITNIDHDMPESVWDFIKQNGFFGMIIPKQYGGKEFSAYAHSRILVKIASRSPTVSSTVSVPNSLGPAELLLHYGTEEQKNYYLPRLAKGEEIPCFALTGPEAGSDAASIPDSGVVCKGQFEGKEVIGIRLNWEKRYITLAPIATVLGLAFKLHDPDHLIGEQHDLGITCALIPTDTSGITIGRRHFPIHTPFQNGPTQGKDVFIPLDWIIGGVEMAGQGWRMLMDCLSAGRAISLPSGAIGSAKAACFATGAYARVRRQFNMPIGFFEGIQEPLAKIASLAYRSDAACLLTLSAIDAGAKPAILSAIVKLNSTEDARQVIQHALDIQGGRAICLGPHNYLASSYCSTPIAITVEGANILTRNLIVFGQGAIRCHPFVLAEMQAAQDDSPCALYNFDKAFFGHIGFTLSNICRSLYLGLTNARLSCVGKVDKRSKPYYQYLTRISANFALIADAAMLSLGGELKRKENLSARLGDVLSMLFIGSAVLKRFEDDGCPRADRSLLYLTMHDILYTAQEQLLGVLANLPMRPMAWVLRFLTFPIGRRYSPVKDSLQQKVAKLMLSPTATRQRITEGIYTSADAHNNLAILEAALEQAVHLEPLDKRLHKAQRTGQIRGGHFEERLQQSIAAGILTADEAEKLKTMHVIYRKAIDVDDFAADEL